MDRQNHILIVDDDPVIGHLLEAALIRAGYQTSRADSAATLQAALDRAKPDLILLDILLPGDDGLTIARRIRLHSDVPIIFLSALGEERDRVTGLKIGADDYVTKPFGTAELLARIEAVLRRSNGLPGPASTIAFSFQGWLLDVRQRTLANPAGVRITLTSAEFDLFRVLCEHAGTVLGRDRLVSMAQGQRVEPYDRRVDTLIARIRQKIEDDPADPALIKTVRNGGYVFVPPVVEERE
jgi:two-component system, OmpR family, response regulator